MSANDTIPGHDRSPYLTAKEVAGLLGVAVPTVLRWARTGKLRGSKLAGTKTLRIHESDIETFVESHILQVS